MTDWLDYVFEEDYHREELMQTCKNNGKELLQERFREYMEDYQEDYGGDLEERKIVSWDAYLSGGEKAFIVFCDEADQQKVKEIL